MKFGKTVIVSFILGITFAGTLTFAAWATATWNDTNSWISNGAVISAQKIAENFEWLKREIYANTSTIQNNTTNINNISTGVSAPPVCTGSGKVLQWDGGSWICVNSMGVVAGCNVSSSPVLTTNIGASGCWGGATHLSCGYTPALGYSCAPECPNGTTMYTTNTTCVGPLGGECYDQPATFLCIQK